MAELKGFRPLGSTEDNELKGFRPLGQPQEAPIEGGKWGNRLGASIDNYQASLYGVAEAVTGANWATEGRERNERDAEVYSNRVRRLGGVESYKDVASVGDAADYVGGLAVGSLPYIAEAAVGGLIGRGLAVGARTAASTAGEMGMVAAQRQAQKRVAYAATAGGVAASYPSSVGEVLGAQREETGGSVDLLSAAALGVPFAALNAIGLEGAAARGALRRNVFRPLDEATGAGGVAKRIGANTALTAGKESFSEVGQTAITQVGRNQVNPEAGYFGDEAMERYAEAAVGGAALGGLIGGVGGARRSDQYRYEQMDLMRAEADARAQEQRAVEEQRARSELLRGRDEALDEFGGERVLRGIAPGGIPLEEFTKGMYAPPPLEGKARAEREAEYGEMLDEPTNLRAVDAETGLERVVDTGELYGMPATQAPATLKVEIDPRATAALGSAGTKKAQMLGSDLYRLADEGLATEAEVDDFINDMATSKAKAYKPVQEFINDRRNSATTAPAGGTAAPAGLAGGTAPSLVAQPPGSPGAVGGVLPVAGRDGAAGAPVASGPEAVPVGDGVTAESGDALTEAPAEPYGDQLKKRFRQVLNRVPPETQRRVLSALGMDQDLNFSPEGRQTFDQIAASNPDKAVTRQAVEKSVKKFLKQLAGDRKAMSPKDLSAIAAMNTWFDSATNAAAAPAPGKAPLESDAFEGGEAFEGQVEVSADRVDGPEVASAEVVAEPEVEGDLPADDAVSTEDLADEVGDFDLDAQVTQRDEVRREAMLLEATGSTAKKGSVEDILGPQIERGEVIPMDIEESATEWSDQRLDVDPEWDALDAVIQAAWVRSYARDAANGETQARLIDEQKALNDQRAKKARPADTGAGSSRAGSQESAAARVAPGTDRAASQVQGAIRTPRERWEELATSTPGMPTWADLGSPQQKAWKDQVDGGTANLAGAVRVAGGNPRGPLSSTASGRGVPGASQSTSLEQIASMEGFSDGLSQLRVIGLPHASEWVNEWRVGTENTYHAEGGRQIVTLEPVGENRGRGSTAFDLVHEVGHAVDAVHFGGVFSSHPDLAFSGTGANISPRGRIAAEVGEARQWNPGLFEDLLAYPFSQEQFGDIITTSERASQELFAQLFAMHANPKLRAILQDAAPEAARFIQAVVNELKETRAEPAHTRGTTYRRAASFETAAAKRESRVRPGDSGRAGRNSFASARDQRVRQALDELGRTESRAARTQAAMQPAARGALTDIRNFFKRKTPWVLTSFQLAQQFGKQIASLRDYVALADGAKQERIRLQRIFHDVAVEWDALEATEKTQLNELTQRATLKEMHPDLAFNHKDNAHLARTDKVEEAALRAEHQALAASYGRLSPAGKKVYQDAKKTLGDSWKLRAAAYQGLVDRTYSESIASAMEADDFVRAETLRVQGAAAQKEYENQMASIKGPYFPLMRFGEYLAVGESADYLDLKDELKTAEGDGRTKLQKRLDAMKKDPAHYIVSAHESRSDMDRAVKDYAARGLQARADMAGLKLDQLRSVTQDTIKHLTDAVDAKVGSKEAGPIKDALQEVFLRGLPEMHALRREAQRKGVEGASADMLRAFSAAGQSNAFYASRLQYAGQMADAMFRMKAEVKGNIDLSHVQREMQERMALDMKYTETPMQDIASSISWAYQLGVSPAYILINTLQPFLVTAPVMAAKYGMGKTSVEIGRAGRDALSILKAARFKDGKWDWWSGISEDSIPGPSRNEERAAIRVLMQRGILDDGMQHELNMFAQDGARWMARANRVMGWATQQVEVANRMTTALAAFRLARKDGKTEAEATEYAYEMVQGTQFDYSAEGSARVMREGGGVPLAKLVFQFRRYQQGMLYLLGDNIKKSFGTDAEAKQARATVAYLSVATGMAAGVTGLPFIGLYFTLANLLRDEDDEDGDAETVLRNALFDMTGDKETANVLAKGLPALFGADMSKRVGLADIHNPIPFARFEQAKTGRDTMREAVFNALGPAASLAGNMLDGAQMIGEGDFAKGVEKLVPKAAADVLRAVRYQTGGMTDRRGDQILGPEEIGAWNTTLRSLGLQSVQEANYYEGTSAKMNLKLATEDRRGKIGNRFKAAMRTGDMADVRAAIKKYNADHPGNPILPKDEIRWRKDALKAQSQRNETGIKLDPKRDARYEEVMRFAR